MPVHKVTNLGTLPLTVKKISHKTKFTLDFRPLNALNSDIFKWICGKFPKWHFLKIEIITEKTAY